MKKILTTLTLTFLFLTTLATLSSINHCNKLGGRDLAKAEDAEDSLSIAPFTTKHFVTPSKEALEKDDLLNTRKEVPLKADNQQVKITIKSHPLETLGGQTDVFAGDQIKPQFSISGYLSDAHPLDLNYDGNEELEIEIITGQLVNTIVYRYQSGSLEPIPIYMDNLKGVYGVTSYHVPKFEDINEDGVVEMLAYHTSFPLDKEGTVEVYKFDGLVFTKVGEYEEITSDFYDRKI